MKTICRKCRERCKGYCLSDEVLSAFCNGCKRLKRLDSPDMRILPVYTLDALLEAVESDLPILTNNGLLRFDPLTTE